MNKLHIKKFILTIIFFGLFSFSKTYAATFSLSPEKETFYKNCVSEISILVDTKSDSSNAADIEISYNKNEIEVIEVLPGNAYEVYFINEIDDSSGTIRLASGSFMGVLSGQKTFATIRFASKGNTVDSNFRIKFEGVGETKDSNIADSTTSKDLLTSVTNGSYNFTSSPYGSCTSDITPPDVIFNYPTFFQTGIPQEARIDFNITDDVSGVNLNSLQFTLNGYSYKAISTEVSYSGNMLNYKFLLVPNTTNPILINSSNTFIVSGEDNAGNAFLEQIVFNTPEITPLPSQTPVTTPISTTTPRTSPTLEVDCSLCPTEIKTVQIGEGLTCEDIQTDIINESFPNLKTILANNWIVDNLPFVKSLPDNVKSSIGSTTIVAAAFLLNLLPFLALANTPGLVFNLFSYLLGKKINRPWGIVMDRATGKPIQYAICQLFTAGTKTLVNQTLSDSEGRYSFPIIEGSYRLEVSKQGYDKTEEKIIINEASDIMLKDVLLAPIDLKAKLRYSSFDFKQIIRNITRVYQKFLPVIFIGGFLIATFSVFYTYNLINLIIFIFYILIIGIQILFKLRGRLKYSAVIDSKSVLRVPNALVKIFDMATGKLIDSKITSENGYFDFLGDPGEYLVHVSIRGYNFPSEIQTDLKQMQMHGILMLRATLNKNNNRLKLLVDPIMPL